MKENLMRFLYAILGVWIGFEACSIKNAESGNVGIGLYLIFIVLSILYSLIIKEEYLDTTPKEIIGLAVGLVFSYPIAYVLQYLVAVCMFIRDIISWLLQFEIMQLVAFIIVVIVIIAVGYFVYDQVKYSKKKSKKSKKS